jgi:hypothetical protein
LASVGLIWGCRSKELRTPPQAAGNDQVPIAPRIGRRGSYANHRFGPMRATPLQHLVAVRSSSRRGSFQESFWAVARGAARGSCDFR